MENTWQGHAGAGCGVVLNVATSNLYSNPVRDQLGEYGVETKEPVYTDGSYGVANCVNALATNLFKPAKKKSDYSYVVFATYVDALPVIIGYMKVKQIRNVAPNHFLRCAGKCRCAELNEHWAVKGEMHFVSWSDAMALTKFWFENCTVKNKSGLCVANAESMQKFVEFFGKFDDVTKECADAADEMRFSEDPEDLRRKGASKRFLRYEFFASELPPVEKLAKKIFFAE